MFCACKGRQNTYTVWQIESFPYNSLYRVLGKVLLFSPITLRVLGKVL